MLLTKPEVHSASRLACVALKQKIFQSVELQTRCPAEKITSDQLVYPIFSCCVPLWEDNPSCLLYFLSKIRNANKSAAFLRGVTSKSDFKLVKCQNLNYMCDGYFWIHCFTLILLIFVCLNLAYFLMYLDVPYVSKYLIFMNRNS